MSVIIKGMIMPKCCNDCPFLFRLMPKSLCQVPLDELPGEEELDNQKLNERPVWCPLKEVENASTKSKRN